jgi:DNA-binding NarL/FixJ family response regulator
LRIENVILIVEDFKPFQSFVSALLQEKGYSVNEVSDGLEAVRCAVDLNPDLILMDIGLPTLNGIEAARQIRQLVPQSKIVFVTQETSTAVVEEARKVGASGYVRKARAASDLLPAIATVLRGEQFVSRGLDGFKVCGELDSAAASAPLAVSARPSPQAQSELPSRKS